MTTDDLVTLACTVCGFRLLVDPVDAKARLFHHGDGGHRVIPPPLTNGAITPVVRLSMRAELLAIAVRLADMSLDVESILARVEESGGE